MPTRVTHRLIPAHAGKTLITSAANSTVRAHPRSRGENARRRFAPGTPVGSSPLTRGKRSSEVTHALARGLIPAHAGKTASSFASPTTRRAHPRSRGENHHLGIVPVIPSGSSPLTRGKHAPLAAVQLPRRLIPAHAGKTTACSPASSTRRAHPRSRGENEIARAEDVNANGSSPLTRGKPWKSRSPASIQGLIPAHAGKTGLRQRRYLGCRAHPRSRGENRPTPTAVSGMPGSSPLTRGKLANRIYADCETGLIPAHAGKTASQAAAWSLRRAHPRSRGENPAEDPRKRAGEGLIPAHAGKTGESAALGNERRAHPRSRGENLPEDHPEKWAQGSSPLTRGKHAADGLLTVGDGLIPAHAGKTPWSVPSSPCLWAHPRSRGENRVDHNG